MGGGILFFASLNYFVVNRLAELRSKVCVGVFAEFFVHFLIEFGDGEFHQPVDVLFPSRHVHYHIERIQPIEFEARIKRSEQIANVFNIFGVRMEH